MANWSDLKAAVASIVKTNGNKEITGQLLQNVLNNIISNVGLNSSFAGIATPETNPGTPDGNVFYLATKEGTYSNFNGIVIEEGEAVILEWKGSWIKKPTGFATEEKLSKLTSFSRNRATGLLHGEMEMNISKGNCNFIFNITLSSCFIYHESGYYSTTTPINKNFAISTELSIIYYDNSKKDILRATNINDVPLDAVVFEVFYTYQESVVQVAWTSPFITKSGPYADNNSCAFFNAKKAQKQFDDTMNTVSLQGTEVERLSGSVFGKTYEKKYEKVDLQAVYEIDALVKEGSTLEFRYESFYVSRCAIGLRFSDGTSQNDVASIAHNKPHRLIAKKDINQVVFYTSYVNQEATSKAANFYVDVLSETRTLADEVNKYYLKRYATGIFYMKMSMAFSVNTDNTGSCNVKTSDFNAEGVYGYIYSTAGYVTLTSEIDKKLTIQSGTNIIYYDVDSQDILIAYSISSVPANSVILEVFYSYQGRITKVAWTSPFIEKTGYQNYNSNCSFSNPDESEHIKGLLLGKEETAKTYESVSNNTTYSLVFSAPKDSIIRMSFESDNVPYCVLGVDFKDGTQHYNLALLKKGEYYDYKAEKDVYKIDFYTQYTQVEAFLTIKGQIIGLISQFATSTEKIKQLEEKIPTVLPKLMSAKIFKRVGCIGDSYTAGFIKTSNNYADKSVKNAWPHYMETLTGNKYDNWAVSGSTAKGWVLGAAGLSSVKAEGNKCQAYVIGLMINDRNDADWNRYYTPTGTIDDIGTDADSYYAYYYKLIQEVISANTEAFIFCNTCPKWSPTDAYNVAVKDVVNYCKAAGQKVYLCDIAADKYSEYYDNALFAEDYINGHYSSIGYEYMAECYIHVMSDVINANIKDFQDVAFIPFD